jgi:predicted aspartyl protease
LLKVPITVRNPTSGFALKDDVPFEIDTGASNTIILADIAEALGLRFHRKNAIKTIDAFSNVSSFPMPVSFIEAVVTLNGIPHVRKIPVVVVESGTELLGVSALRTFGYSVDVINHKLIPTAIPSSFTPHNWVEHSHDDMTYSEIIDDIKKNPSEETSKTNRLACYPLGSSITRRKKVDTKDVNEYQDSGKTFVYFPVEYEELPSQQFQGTSKLQKSPKRKLNVISYKKAEGLQQKIQEMQEIVLDLPPDRSDFVMNLLNNTIQTLRSCHQ